MNLASYQATVTRVCFDRSPNRADLAALEHTERWQIYRRMVRARLERIVRTAFPRSIERLGESFQAHFDTWLAEKAPQSPLFRRLPDEFAANLLPSLDAHGQDLVHYEQLAWRLKDAPEEIRDTAPLTFDAPILLRSAVGLLATSHLVHKRPAEDAHPNDLQGKRWHLLLYRNNEHRVVTLVINSLTHDLVRAWQSPHSNLADSIRAVTQRRGDVMGQAFMESLGGLLADYIERGIVLGSATPGS